MARRADSSRMRAKAVLLPWATLAARQLRSLGRLERFAATAAFEVDDRQVKLRSQDIHLTWACGPALGVPRGPFTVWVRPPQDQPKRVSATVFTGQVATVFWGGVEAGCVRVRCRPLDSTRPVAVFLHRTGSDTDHTVAATSVSPTSPDPVTLVVRTGGATYAVVENGTDVTVWVEPLEQIVNDPAWQPLEVVGLPVDQPDAGFDYDAGDQGLVASPVSPVEAAVDRLRRGGPPLGWAPVTEGGLLAPPWAPPDPKLLVEEVRSDLLPELPPMYDPGVREYQQFAVTSPRTVDPPSQDGRISSASTTADTGPWPMLLLPAQSDPFLNLATGFGAHYSLEPLDEGQVAVGRCDFLVTGTYSTLAPPDRGRAEFAAYAPAPDAHLVVPTPTGLASELAGLVGPVTRDAPWRESVRLSWDRVPKNAATSPVTEAALARYEPGSSAATSLLPPRWSGGDRPLLVSPDGPEGETGHDRVAVVDGGQEIPIGSGGRSVGYAVAVSDVHGIWSPWQDVPWAGSEPAPQPPRVISAALDTGYTGSASCPSTLRTELAVEWAERTPARIDVVAIYYPMATSADLPPAGIGPSAATPAGCFRRDFGFTWAGDEPVGSGCTVRPLKADGTETASPAGPAQGDGGRRYAVSAAVPDLDFSSTPRWGVQLWVRRHLAVGPSPSAWAPDPAHPARASAASPVPVVPLPPPPLPGVPMGSTPDAQGRSHVRVAWSLPAGADVRTCIVWEASETSLRQRAGLPQRAADTVVPGQRLLDLRNAYDAMTPTQRRAAFRRLHELPGTARTHDVALPKGSTDIHLFLVTTMTRTGVESPWPAGPTPHEHLQAVMAPRLRRPAPPVARPSVAPDGTVTVKLFAASPIEVKGFRLFRTTSEVAGRDVATMGPAFADVVATPPPSPPAPPPAPPAVDPVLGQPVYRGTWTGTLPGRWDPWLLRAVAIPVDTVPQKAERGLPSTASDVVSLVVPPGDPVLEPLAADVWGGDHRGVVVRTASTAPPRVLPAGVHRLDGTAGAQPVAQVDLPDLALTPLATAPAGAAAAPVLEQGTRVAGRSPLALWFTRPVAADPVAVTLRLTDPLGRVVEQSLTVPGWTPPAPDFTVSIVDLFAIVGRGVVVGIDTDADPRRRPPFVLEVYGRQRLPLFSRPGLPSLPGPFGPGRLWPPVLRPRSLSASFPFDEIPWADGGYPRNGEITVVRNRVRRPPRGVEPLPRYQAFIPLTTPLDVTVSVVSPDGVRVSDRRGS